MMEWHSIRLLFTPQSHWNDFPQNFKKKKSITELADRKGYNHLIRKFEAFLHYTSRWDWILKDNSRKLERIWHGASLVALWLRICLLMQGTRVQSLVQEDPTCCGPTKPMHHNYWACALEPVSHNYWAHVPQLLKPTCLEPMLQNKRSHCNEKPMLHNKE